MISLFTNSWKLNNIEAILFDKDGTLQNDHIYWGKLAENRIKEIIKHFNLDENFFEELCIKIGYNPNDMKLIKNGPVGTLSRTEVVEFMVRELQNYNVKTDFDEISQIFDKVNKIFLSDITPYVFFLPGAKNFLDEIKKKNIKMGLVTSDSTVNAHKILEILQIDNYFDCVIGKDSCDEDKKTGKPAVIAMQKLNSNPSNTIAIGDAPMDYSMAEKAGLKGCILVATGQVDIANLEVLSKYCAQNLDEVKIK